ncbi:hypothetical protein [Fibrella aquatica]|uniref:hypothetical protein n=1 Tax=Fibrella aquatica TaxID=3242487 RepID=UPI003521BA81
MKTNALILTTTLVASLLVSPLLNAQQRPDGPPDREHGLAMRGHGKKRPHTPEDRSMDGRAQHGPQGKGRQRGEGQRGGLTSLTTVSGTVGQWAGNDDFILDGFTLNTGSGTPSNVKFPPHLGTELQKAIKPGSSVSVMGFTETRPGGESFFRLNSVTVGKTTIMDTPPTRPATPPVQPALVTATGKITDYQLDRGGRVKGLILDEKTVVAIPAHTAYQLTELAKKGNTITVQGYPRPVREGQVQLEKLTVLRASVLTINGQQYLVR